MPAPRKANPRTKIFRWRLNDNEDEQFRRIAKDRGVDRAELIREVLGLSPEPQAEETPLPPAAVPAARPDPKTEPGAAALTEVADRIQRKKAKKHG